MLVSGFISRVRELISDEVEEYRYDDTELMTYITDGQNQIWRRHPEAFYVSSVTTTAPSAITETDDILSISDDYIDTLLYYVAFRALSKDSEDSVNMNLAATYRTYFAGELA